MLVPVEGTDTARGRSQVVERGQDADGGIGEVEGVYIAPVVWLTSECVCLPVVSSRCDWLAVVDRVECVISRVCLFH